MKALVTGCAGFIGSHLADRLIKDGHKVIGIDNLSNGKPENLNPKLKFWQADIRSAEIEDYFQGVDVVFHQAAIGSVPRSIKWPDDTYDANVEGFRNILRICEKLNIKKLVYASSSSVYGDHQNVPKTEDRIGKQLSPYSASKRVNELMAEVSPVTCIGLRYFNVYGPRQRQDSEYAAVIPKWIEALQAGQSIHMHGDGTAYRDFTFVSDAVEANLLAANHDKTDVFNIGTGNYTLLNDLLIYLMRSLDVPKDQVRLCRDTDNPPAMKASLADISKAQSLLGYLPKIHLIDGVKRTVDYFKKAVAA